MTIIELYECCKERFFVKEMRPNNKNILIAFLKRISDTPLTDLLYQSKSSIKKLIVNQASFIAGQ